jgi:ParB/RepB/Spo0J family partition protein
MDRFSDFFQGRREVPRELELDLIETRPQVRHEFDEAGISALAESIKAVGLLEPLLVVEEEGRYVLVAGERRLRAAKRAGLQSVPVQVLERVEQVPLVQLAENYMREDLTPKEVVAVVDQLTAQGVSKKQIAQATGISEAMISRYRRVLACGPALELLRRDGSLRAALELAARLSPEAGQDAGGRVDEPGVDEPGVGEDGPGDGGSSPEGVTAKGPGGDGGALLEEDREESLVRVLAEDTPPFGEDDGGEDDGDEETGKKDADRPGEEGGGDAALGEGVVVIRSGGAPSEQRRAPIDEALDLVSRVGDLIPVLDDGSLATLRSAVVGLLNKMNR